MTEASKITYTQQELDQLQRLRTSLLAFQNGIGSLPADEQSNFHNEQFNQLRREAKMLLKRSAFEQQVPKAITEDMLISRSQRVIIPRVSAIVIFGVILALLGLGINSIILEDVLINSLGCLVSTTGMFLIIGAFFVLGMNLRRKQLTNYGDLYQRCDALMYEIDHTLTMAIPNWADRPTVDVPQIPSVVELALDSLNNQAEDWQQKLRTLEEKRLAAGPDAPMELIINIDFVQRELSRVNGEIERLNGRLGLASTGDERPDFRPERVGTPAAREIAHSRTEGMPALKPVDVTEPEPEDGAGDVDAAADSEDTASEKEDTVP